MIHGTGSNLNARQVHMIRLTAERESSRDSKLAFKESARRALELKQEQLRVEAEKLVAEIESATGGNPFGAFVGRLASAAVGAIVDIAESVGKLVPAPVAAVMGGVFAGTLIPAAQAVLGAAAGLAPHAVSAAVSTNLLTRLVDVPANIFLAHGAKADLARATIELDGVEQALSSVTAEREERRSARDAARSSSRRVKQQVQKEAAQEATRSRAWRSAGPPSNVLPNGGSAVAEAQAASVESCAKAESDLGLTAEDAQRRALTLQAEAGALRAEATRAQHDSEVAGAWIAAGQLLLEVVGIIATLGATTVVTSCAAAADATLNAVSGGLGLVGQLFDDEGARRTLRQAEELDVQANAATRAAEQARSEAKSSRADIEATLASAEELLDAQTAAAEGGGTSSAQARAVQSKRGVLELADARDAQALARASNARAQDHRERAIDQRRQADAESATDGDWKVVFDVSRAALSLAGAVVGAEIPNELIGKVLHTAGKVASAADAGRNALDGTHGAEELRLAEEEERRAQLASQAADDSLRAAQRSEQRRRSIRETTLQIQRDLGPVRA